MKFKKEYIFIIINMLYLLYVGEYLKVELHYQTMIYWLLLV